ncbi:MAG: serine hydrolase [Phaeodactylibacter sp.]|nr:serine hydrolase [Phaeodactylibacter sp.]
MKSSILFVSVICLAIPLFAQETLSFIAQKDIAAKADELCSTYQAMGWFEGVILIAQNGKTVFEKAYGLADHQTGAPNTMQTKFRIGSINKNYTDILVMQLVEQGKLSLDQTLADFELGFPPAVAEKITLRHLMTHTAGFGDIFIPEYLDNIRAFKDIDDILPLLLNEPLLYEPGTDQMYSNYGYSVLRAILEKVSGQSFKTLLQQQILDVIGAQDTYYDIAEQIQGEAQSYRYTLAGEKVDHTAQLEYPTPDGGMYATAADVLRFFKARHFSNKLVSDQSKLAMATDYQETDLTWEKILNSPRAVEGSAGGGPGVSALALTFFKDRYQVILLANTDQMVTEEIGFRLEQAMQGKTYAPPTLPPANYLYQIRQQKGDQFLLDNFESIVSQGNLGEPNAMLLNQIGYDLLYTGNAEEAIAIFALNVQLFPNDANPYDSLAEAYLESGDREKALHYYKKALEIDPDFEPSLMKVKELEGQK